MNSHDLKSEPNTFSTDEFKFRMIEVVDVRSFVSLYDQWPLGTTSLLIQLVKLMIGSVECGFQKTSTHTLE